MSKTIELTHLSALDANAIDEPTIIDTCIGRNNLALLASWNQVAVYDHQQGNLVQSLRVPLGDKICSASFHPSGNHLLLAFSDRLQLANVLVDGIQIFWEEYAVSCTDAKFNRRGTIFAAIICGSRIEVYDFLKGEKMVTISCSDTVLAKLSWGVNCTLHAVCDEGQRLCKWDALTGTKLAEYNSEDGSIIAYTVADNGKAIIAKRNGSIINLSVDLKSTATRQVGEEYILTGTINVSNEGLVFVGLCHRDHQTRLVRIYSAVGEDYFDHYQEERVRVMTLSPDSTHLLTNKSIFQVQDRRGYSQYITGCLDLSGLEDEANNNTTNQAELLMSTTHLEAKDAQLVDLQSKLNEVQIMNELKLRSVQQTQSEELTRLKDSCNSKLAKLVEQKNQLLQEKILLAQTNQLTMKETMSAQIAEIHRLEEKYKAEILDQVTTYCRIEKEQQREALIMEAEQELQRKKYEEELAEFRMEADKKLTKQSLNSEKLSSHRDLVERQSKARISQLEDEIDESILAMTNKFKNEVADQQQRSGSLVLSTGVIRKRIESTQDSLVQAKEQVTSLLHQQEQQQKQLTQKEEEKERLEAVKASKEKDLSVKKETLSKLSHLNKQIVKAHDIDSDRLQDIEKRVENGPLVEQMKQLCQEIVETNASIEEQMETNKATFDKIGEVTELVGVEKRSSFQWEKRVSCKLLLLFVVKVVSNPNTFSCLFVPLLSRSARMTSISIIVCFSWMSVRRTSKIQPSSEI